ncbi:ABC transporter substrate-binding protein, partial [candidate division KSB1 bacterium]
MKTLKHMILILILICSWNLLPAQEYKRIISLSPNITGILYDLGAESKIVGVTDFCRVHDHTIDRVGGTLNPNLEMIISLKPDLIICPDFKNLLARLSNLNIEILNVKNETIDEVLESIKIIGEKLEKEKLSENMVAEFKNKIFYYSKLTENAERIRVLFVVSKDITGLKNIYAAGKNTFLNEIIRICGGTNIIKERTIRYPKISLEDLIDLDPQIIFDTSLGVNLPEEQIITNSKSWERLNNIAAVREGKVIYLNDHTITIPGTNIIESIKKLGKYIHPEIFNE